MRQTSRERPKWALYLRLKIVKGGEIFENSNKLKLRFLNSVTVPQNVIGGTLLDFLTSIVLQNIRKLKGRPFGGIQKASKKVA